MRGIESKCDEWHAGRESNTNHLLTFDLHIELLDDPLRQPRREAMNCGDRRSGGRAQSHRRVWTAGGAGSKSLLALAKREASAYDESTKVSQICTAQPDTGRSSSGCSIAPSEVTPYRTPLKIQSQKKESTALPMGRSLLDMGDGATETDDIGLSSATKLCGTALID